MSDEKDFHDIDGVEKYIEPVAPQRVSNPEYVF